MWFGPSGDGRDDHYLQHQDHNAPSVYQFFFQDLVYKSEDWSWQRERWSILVGYELAGFGLDTQITQWAGQHQKNKFGYGTEDWDISHLAICTNCFHPYFPWFKYLIFIMIVV